MKGYMTNGQLRVLKYRSMMYNSRLALGLPGMFMWFFFSSVRLPELINLFGYTGYDY